MQLFLLGFMGSGKSTIGRTLADRLDFDFIDLDQEIEKIEKRSISDIFKEEGEKYFRSVEKKELKKLKKVERRVISLGGGTPCFENNLFYINRIGVSIYLRTPRKLLISNLSKDQSSRPLVKGLTPKRLESKINAMMRQRSPYYNKARYTFLNNGDMESLIERIIKRLDLTI